MKAAFLGSSAEKIQEVYGSKQMAALKERVDFLPGIFDSVAAPELREADVIFATWGMLSCSEAEIREYLPNVKAVFYAAGSVQAFAAPFLKCGVRVFSAWQANAVAVADFACAQILLALKGYFRVQPKTRTDRKAAAALQAKYPGVYDARVGLLGCGAIGSRVAERLKANDVEVMAFDPFLEEERARSLGVRKAEMAELFRSCDVVSNHLANLPATVGIIKREHLLSMRPYSTFINTGRGPQLDEKDLYDMLTADDTRVALLDVMTDEANSDSNPLNALPNCLITPHMAGASGNEVRRLADYMIEAYDRMLAGQACDFEVTEDMLATMA